MKDLGMAYVKCMKMVRDLGIEPGYIWKVRPFKAKSKWGLCTSEGFGVYTISISTILLDDSVSDKALESTMIHEILHTVEGCQNHGSKWKKLANKVNEAYGYDIKRTTSPEEKGEEVAKLCSKIEFKHAIKCKKCGYEIFFQRECKSTKHPNWYTHIGCGGTFFREY